MHCPGSLLWGSRFGWSSPASTLYPEPLAFSEGTLQEAGQEEPGPLDKAGTWVEWSQAVARLP